MVEKKIYRSRQDEKKNTSSPLGALIIFSGLDQTNKMEWVNRELASSLGKLKKTIE